MPNMDPLVLAAPLSATSPSDPNDVLTAKRAFNRLGYYALPSYGLTPYPDQPLFDGIRAYQEANDLNIDGLMMPGGETEQSVNILLAERGATGEGEKRAEGATFTGGRRHSPLHRERAISKRRQEAWHTQFNVDSFRCGALPALPHIAAPQRRAKCMASAFERLATCIRGFNPPPLYTGE